MKHEQVILRRLLIEEHKCIGEEVATAAHEGWLADMIPLQDLYSWIDACEQRIVWQDSCSQLRNSSIG